MVLSQTQSLTKALRYTTSFNSPPFRSIGHHPRRASTFIFLDRTVMAAKSTATVTSVVALASSQTLPTTETPPAPPARIYDIYSWRRRAPNARLVYIRDIATANSEVAKLRPGPLGFDLEWRPNYVKGQKENPVALVQLANEDTILLIQISAMRTVPESLRLLLLDTRFIKAGVGIQNDCKKLFADYAVSTRKCVDLSLLARSADNARWKGKYNQPIGLARLCETYEELTLSKGKVQRSNWERMLDPNQQDYAANDCHSGLVLFTKLHNMVMDVSPLPSISCYTFDCVDGRLYEPTPVNDFLTLLWQPQNPNYDPGPPPPPRVPKDDKDDKDDKDKKPKKKQLDPTAKSKHTTSQQGQPVIPHVPPIRLSRGPYASNIIGNYSSGSVPRKEANATSDKRFPKRERRKDGQNLLNT